MPRRRNPVPAYTLHKPSGQAVVKITGADGVRRSHYLGKYGTPESCREYERLLNALPLITPDTDPAEPSGAPAAEPLAGRSVWTVNEALTAYSRHVHATYPAVVDPTENPPPPGPLSDRRRYSGTARVILDALHYVRRHAGHLRLAEFSPRVFKTVREGMVRDGNSRRTVNSRCVKVRQFLRWCVEEELIPPAVLEAVRAVPGLRAGRSDAAEPEPVGPADPAHVAAALPFMPSHVAAIVRLQRMTGARCGELCSLRSAELDRSDPAVWVYSPATHKGSWRGKSRAIYFGARCQEVLAPFLAAATDPAAFVFSPAAAEEARNAERSELRKTPRWESHMRRNAAKRAKGRRRPPRTRYYTQSVRQSVARACERAGVPIFTPHQLRHLAATEIRAEFGPEVARAVLGHTLAAMTEHYSRDVDRGLALKAVARFG